MEAALGLQGLADRQEQLIDVEHWIEDGKWRYLGVWRAASDYGPVHVGLWTADFVAKCNDLGPQKTLVDIEEYTALPLRVP